MMGEEHCDEIADLNDRIAALTKSRDDMAATVTGQAAKNQVLKNLCQTMVEFLDGTWEPTDIDRNRFLNKLKDAVS
jgi:hypothetical protein